MCDLSTFRAQIRSAKGRVQNDNLARKASARSLSFLEQVSHVLLYIMAHTNDSKTAVCILETPVEIRCARKSVPTHATVRHKPQPEFTRFPGTCMRIRCAIGSATLPLASASPTAVKFPTHISLFRQPPHTLLTPPTPTAVMHRQSGGPPPRAPQTKHNRRATLRPAQTPPASAARPFQCQRSGKGAAAAPPGVRPPVHGQWAGGSGALGARRRVGRVWLV